MRRRGSWWCALVLVWASWAGAQDYVVDRLQFVSMWDASYFYVGAILEDINVVGRCRSLGEDTVTDDSVELLLDLAPDRLVTGRPAELAGSSVKLGMSAAEGIWFARGGGEAGKRRWVLAPPFVRGAPVLRQAVKVLGTLNDTTDADLGWQVEVAIPWAVLGQNGPPVGQTWRFGLLRRLRGDTDATYGYPRGAKEDDPATWALLAFRAGTGGLEPGRALICPQVPPLPPSSGPRQTWPLIDGEVAEREWPLVHRIDVRLAPESLRPLPPVVYEPPTSEARALPEGCDLKPRVLAPRAARRGFGGDPLTLARYVFGYQADPRRSDQPLRDVFDQAGHSLLSAHPLDGLGPWCSTLRVGWHREQLRRAAAVGIDVLLAEYPGDAANRRAWSLEGLRSLILAAQQMRLQRLPCPELALLVPATALPRAGAGWGDLTQPADQETLFRLIRDFYLHVPPPLRAEVTDGPRRSCLVCLERPPRELRLSDGFIGWCESRFRAEFGRDLLWVGSATWGRRSVSLDGFVSFDAGVEQHVGGRGRLRLASVGPAWDDAKTAARPTVVPRLSTRAFRESFRATLASPTQWLLLSSFNDLLHGDQLVATREYGNGYERTAQMLATQFANRREAGLAARLRRIDLPPCLAAGAGAQIPVQVANAGLRAWEVDTGVRLGWRWYPEAPTPLLGPDGKPLVDRFSGQPILADKALTDRVRASDLLAATPGQTVEALLTVTATDDGDQPLPTGRYRLRLEAYAGQTTSEVEEPGPDGQPVKRKVTTPNWLPTASDEPCDVVVEVAPRATMPPLAVEVLEVTMPARLETGPKQRVRVRLRHDGARPSDLACRLGVRYERRALAPWCREDPEPELLTGWLSCGPLPEVAPGTVVTVDADVPTVRADGTRLPLGGDRDWVLVARFAVLDRRGQPVPEVRPYRQAISVLARDWGFGLGAAEAPRRLTAGSPAPVHVTLLNAGTVTWPAERTELVWHWYRFDGALLKADAGRLRLNADLPGGQAVRLKPSVVAPAYTGPLYLLFDVVHDDLVWASLQPSTYGPDLAPVLVHVAQGPFRPVALDGLFNVRGHSFDDDPTQGNFDGHGRSLSAELVPPGADDSPERFYPSGYFERDPGAGRAVVFQYPNPVPPLPPPPPPPKRGKPAPPTPPAQRPKGPALTVVRPAGQTIAVPAGSYRRLHLLGAAVDQDAEVRFGVGTPAGETRLLPPVALTTWDRAPAHGETVGLTIARRHGPHGIEPGVRCWLHHAVVALDPTLTIARLVLPTAPNARLVALTLEAAPAAVGPGPARP